MNPKHDAQVKNRRDDGHGAADRWVYEFNSAIDNDNHQILDSHDIHDHNDTRLNNVYRRALWWWSRLPFAC